MKDGGFQHYLTLAASLVGLVAAIVGLVQDTREDLRLLAGVGLVVLWALCLAVVVLKKDTAYGQGPRFPKLKPWGKLGVIALPLLAVFFLAWPYILRGLIICCAPPTPSSTSTMTATPTPSPTLSPSLHPSLTPTLTLMPMAVCRYQGATDEVTLRQLVLAEAEASMTSDLGIIQDIFAAEAMIIDGQALDHPVPALQHYTDEFAQKAYRGIEHFDIFLTERGVTSTAAWLTSGSRGEFSDNQGPWTSFENGSTLDPLTPYGSDQWTFRRDKAGCWVIVEFRYNAGHVPFPP
jgi:hypothetical protein